MWEVGKVRRNVFITGIYIYVTGFSQMQEICML